MLKLLIAVLALSLFNVSGVAWAQVGGEVSPSDLAAVATYRATMEKVKEDIKAVKAEIKKKNIVLAQALGKFGAEFDPKAVTAAHNELIEARRKLEQVELDSFLIYKKYIPNWAPEASGKSVVISEKRTSSKAHKAGTPQK